MGKDKLTLEQKAEIYKTGREYVIETKSKFAKVWDFLSRSNWSVLIIVIVSFMSLLWFHNNILKPFMFRVMGIQKTVNGYVEIQPEFELFSEAPPTRECSTKITLKGKVEDGGKLVKKDLSCFVDNKGRVYAKREDVSSIHVVNKEAKFDFRFQPGIGVLYSPMTDEIEDIINGAIFVSPLEIYRKVDVDIYANHLRAGGGLSIRLPWRMLSNTFVGAGIAVPYDNLVIREGVIYCKVNF
jgi:hypothetical protein